MKNIKIARGNYREAKQTSLPAFANNVYGRMYGIAVYEGLQPQVQPLPILIEKYENCLTAAQNRGRSEILAKKMAQVALVEQLDIIVIALSILAKDNVQLVVDAGFTPQQDTGARYDNKIPAPIITRAVSTGIKGQVRVSVDDQTRSGAVLTHSVEYSLELESGWQNGTYHNHRTFVVDNLPRANSLWLRLKSIGHGSSQSEWSQPMMVSVL